MSAADTSGSTPLHDIAVIGSGPAGLSAAGHAAELGLKHVLLEAERHVSHTIHRYQRGKHVMAEPQILPLRSPMPFGAGRREDILDRWNAELGKLKVNVQYGQEVTGIEGVDGAFVIRTRAGLAVHARKVILSIGLQGNLRKLGVEGEDLEGVQYQLDDPKEYSGETIVVVGAGDAGVENALGLIEQNRVIIMNRDQEFTRCKEGNLTLVQAAMREGKLEARHGASAVKVERVGGEVPLRFQYKGPNGLETIACHRVIARLGAIPPRKLVEAFGIQFPSSDPSSVPALSETYESNVKGLYIVGALGGYPLIKQAMNQGYEAVEYALGRSVAPADEALLAERFAAFAQGETVNGVLDRIQRSVPLLASVNRLQLREFLLESDIRTPGKGEAVFHRNDYENSFFMIVSGRVRVELGEKDAFLGTGQFFGEMGLVSGRRRSNSVYAEAPCVLIEVPRRAMLKLMASVEAVRRGIDEVFLSRAIKRYLAPNLPDSEIEALVAGGMEVRRYAGGEVLFREGDAPDGLYLIRRGSVMVSRSLGGRDVVLAYLTSGNYVGEMGLINDKPRNATVTAASTTEAIVLAPASFRTVLDRNPAWREQVETVLLQRLQSKAAAEAGQEAGNVVSFLLKQGIGEATDVLLIDESLCVRCDSCEKACADVHDGTSRLDREAGPTYANIHVPTSCRHCEHPHCMKDCPPDAIHRAPGGEVFVDDSCIGCGNCQRNCPYGVIQMAPVDPARRKPGLLSWLFFGLGPEPGREPAPKDKSIPKKAVKCDMCKGVKGGAACVRACPTGAAIRVSPERFLNVARGGD